MLNLLALNTRIPRTENDFLIKLTGGKLFMMIIEVLLISNI